MKEIPVYLFMGFLESGKTKFIQDTLCDSRFNSGEKTLLLVCEEGEEEYDPSRFSGKNVKIQTVEEKKDFTTDNLAKWAKECYAERVMVELNGMWLISEFFDAMPENWAVYQTMFFADANTFLTYNANMRSLVVDKLTYCEMVAFNRCKKDIDKMELHKIIRGTSRRTDIIYEYEDGSTQYDDIEDPLPFNIDAPVIDIKDEDFALFYRDITEEPKKYDGKKIRYKALIAKSIKLPKGIFIGGRHIMTCCEADITFYGLVCTWDKADTLKNKNWKIITADISYKFHKMYKGKGPVLNITSVEDALPPKNSVCTFY